MSEPQSPFGEWDTAAVTMHEIFTAYQRAGFTSDQAFKLTQMHVRWFMSNVDLGGA